MDYLLDWVNLLLRWTHVITAIAWIGSSFYFVLLDNSLSKPQDKELKDKGVNWKYKTFPKAQVVSYYNQAINKDAPHPAAARLWQEFLFSDEGQNLWLKGGARPVRLDAMTKAGTADATAAGALPPVEGTPAFMSVEQSTKASEALKSTWQKAIS